MFHTYILELFRPLLGKGIVLTTFAPRHYAPEDIFLASVNQLRRQHLMYSLTHPGSAMSNVFWHFGLLHSANAALTNLSNPDSQLFFLMSILDYQRITIGFPVMKTVATGFLTVAIKSGFLTVKDARRLRQRLLEDAHEQHAVARIDADFPLDLNSSNSQDPRQRSVRTLAQAFDDLTMTNTPD